MGINEDLMFFPRKKIGYIFIEIFIRFCPFFLSEYMKNLSVIFIFFC